MKNRQYNGQKKKNPENTNNEPQSTTQEEKDWTTRTLLKTGRGWEWGGELKRTTSIIINGRLSLKRERKPNHNVMT